MSNPQQFGGPSFHDELAALSTAGLSDAVMGPIPPLDAPPPPGAFQLLDGRGLFVRRVGPAGRTGPDAWYLHGLAGSSTNWTSLAGVLAEHSTGYQVDLPGHGRSDPPPHGRYALADDADLVASAITRTSTGPVHLVGNSLGGMVAVLLAARHPHLIATLTLISPAVPDLRLTDDRGADPRLALMMLPGTAGVASRRLAAISPGARARGMGQLCFGDPSLISESQYDAAAADLAWRSGLPWVHAGVLGALRSLLTRYLTPCAGSFRSLAASIRVPTLVIWGTRDRLVDARLAPRTAAAFPRASLLILAGVGHTAQMENPMVTARALLAHWSGAMTEPTGTALPPRGEALRTGAPHETLTRVVAPSSA